MSSNDFMMENHSIVARQGSESVNPALLNDKNFASGRLMRQGSDVMQDA
jgi:hypothetical protein